MEYQSTDQIDERATGGKVLSNVSIAQITASALAAVTAMLFSSQIGIAGSVIGVALSAAVTALSSQIYKNFIDASHAKAKERIGMDTAGLDQTKVMPNSDVGTPRHAREAGLESDAASMGSVVPQAHREVGKGIESGAGSAPTAVPPVYSADKQQFAPDHAKYSHAAFKTHQQSVSGSLDVTKKKWFVIVLLTAIGLATVFLTAHIITSATDGAGIGTKPAPIIQVSDNRAKVGQTLSSTIDASASQSKSSSSSGASSHNGADDDGDDSSSSASDGSKPSGSTSSSTSSSSTAPSSSSGSNSSSAGGGAGTKASSSAGATA